VRILLDAESKQCARACGHKYASLQCANLALGSGAICDGLIKGLVVLGGSLMDSSLPLVALVVVSWSWCLLSRSPPSSSFSVVPPPIDPL
jgi:hypothetical protein